MGDRNEGSGRADDSLEVGKDEEINLQRQWTKPNSHMPKLFP